MSASREPSPSAGIASVAAAPQTHQGLKLSPDREDAVSRALRKVARAAHEATLPNDLASVRKALNAVWWAVHDAAEAINEAERVTRDEALAPYRAALREPVAIQQERRA